MIALRLLCVAAILGTGLAAVCPNTTACDSCVSPSTIGSRCGFCTNPTDGAPMCQSVTDAGECSACDPDVCFANRCPSPPPPPPAVNVTLNDPLWGSLSTSSNTPFSFILPDGPLNGALVTSTRHFIQIWDKATGTNLYTLNMGTLHDFPSVWGASPLLAETNANKIVVVMSDATLAIVDVLSARLDEVTPLCWECGEQYGVASPAFSADGNIVALYIDQLQDGSEAIIVYRVSTSETLLKVPKELASNIFALSTEGDLFACAASSDFTPWESSVSIWNINTAELALSISLESDGNDVVSLAFSPDGSSLAMAIDDGPLGNSSVSLYAVETGTLIRTLPCCNGCKGDLASLAFAPNGKKIAALNIEPDTAKRTLCAWDLTAAGAAAKPIQGAIGFTGEDTDTLELRFSPDSESLLLTIAEDGVRIFDAATAKEKQKLASTMIEAVAFSPNRTVATPCTMTSVCIWNATTGSMLRNLTGHTEVVFAVAFSPSGALLASAGADRTVRVWDMSKGTARFVLKGHTDDIRALAFSNNGKVLASGGEDDQILLWDTARGSLIRSVSAKGMVFSLAFSPDSTALVSGTYEGNLALWDVTSGALVRSVSNDSAAILSVAFSADGKMMASGDMNGVVRVWNPANGACVQTIEKVDVYSISTVEFSPSSDMLAVGTDSSFVIIDLKSGETVHEWDMQFEDFACSPDWKYVAIASGIVGVWEMP